MISYNFQSNKFFLFMIKRFKNLSKRTLSDDILDFISICNWVSNQYFDVTLIICKMFDWGNSSLPSKINLIFLNLFKLKLCHEGVLTFLLVEMVTSNHTFTMILILILHGFKFVFLQIWRLLWFFYEAWIIFLNWWHFRSCPFDIQSMVKILDSFIDTF